MYDLFMKDVTKELRLFCLSLLLLVVCGCSAFLTGTDTGKVDDKGNKIYEQSSMVELSTVIGSILGVGGMASAAARIAQNAARTTKALYESNDKAIEETDWRKINTAEAVKSVLKLAQDSHDDSKILKKGYIKFKNRRKAKAG